MSKHRVAIYIDGSNLFYKLRELGTAHSTYFDYRGLSDWLASGRVVTSYRYYVGVVRAEVGSIKAQRLRSEQQKLFSHLEKQHFTIKRGEIINSAGVFHEKGVDVQLAVDLLVGAYEQHYDQAIVISSDSDLVPAIKQVQHLGKNVEYVGFVHKPSLAMRRYASASHLLSVDDIRPFIKPHITSLPD